MSLELLGPVIWHTAYQEKHVWMRETESWQALHMKSDLHRSLKRITEPLRKIEQKLNFQKLPSNLSVWLPGLKSWAVKTLITRTKTFILWWLPETVSTLCTVVTTNLIKSHLNKSWVFDFSMPNFWTGFAYSTLIHSSRFGPTAEFKDVCFLHTFLLDPNSSEDKNAMYRKL